MITATVKTQHCNLYAQVVSGDKNDLSDRLVKDDPVWKNIKYIDIGKFDDSFFRNGLAIIAK